MEAIYATLRDRQGRLAAALRSRSQEARRHVESIESRAIFKKPFDRLHHLSQQLDLWQARASRATKVLLDRNRQRAAALTGHLESLSPLSVLARGYSLTTRTTDGKPIFDAAQLHAGETIHTRFSRGNVVSRVENIDE